MSNYWNLSIMCCFKINALERNYLKVFLKVSSFQLTSSNLPMMYSANVELLKNIIENPAKYPAIRPCSGRSCCKMFLNKQLTI